MKAKKFVVFLLMFILVFGSSLNVLASDEDSSSNVVYDEFNDESLNAPSTDVNVVKSSTFSVVIPKKIILPGLPTNEKHEQSYNITVKGDIISNKQIRVIPQGEFSLSQSGKNDVTATVSQTAKMFQLAGYDTDVVSVDSGVCRVPFSMLNSQAGYVVEDAGKVSVASLPAGTWNGSFSFDISLTEALSAVVFDGNGSTGGFTANQSKIYGENLSLNDNGFVRDGYEFVEWNTEFDGSGDTYSSEDMYTVDSPVTLYAQWSPNDEMNIYHHHTYSGNVAQNNSTSAASGSYADNYTRLGSGGCFTVYSYGYSTPAYYATNCGKAEGQYACGKTAHTHVTSCYEGHERGAYKTTSITCPRCGAQAKYGYYEHACTYCGTNCYTTKCSSCGLNADDGDSWAHCSARKTCTLEEHTHTDACKHHHTGNSSSGGGCYGTYIRASTTEYYNRGCGHTDGELLYSVKYNLCGGSVSGTPYTYNATANSVTLVSPSKSGYAFLGWATKSNPKESDVTYNAGSAIPVTNGMKLVAVYRRN